MADTERWVKISIGLHGRDRKLAKKLLREGVRKFLPVQVLQLPEKARITYEEIMTDVMFADLLKTSIEIMGSNFEGPSQDRVMDYLQNLTPEKLEELNKECAKEIAFRLKKLRRFSFNVAIDFTYVPYYGDPNNPYVVGIKHTKGTNYAFVYCVVSIVVDGLRKILYCFPVTKETDNVMFHVEKAMNFIKELGIRISTLFLDREFYVEEVVNFLNERVHYIIPALQSEKFLRYAKMYSTFPFSLPVVLEGWEIENSKTKEVAKTNLAIIKEIDDKGEEHIYGFITNLPKERYQDDINILSELYSKRWGIETTFRVEDKFDIYTTTRNGIIRYFFFLFSCILYNFWVTINFIRQVKNIDNGSFEIIVKVDELRIVLIYLFGHKLRQQKFNLISELLAEAIEENEKSIIFAVCIFHESHKKHTFIPLLSSKCASPAKLSRKQQKAF